MKRNYGVDFLRILSMFMVVIMHILKQGGLLLNAEPFSAKYCTVWLLEIICYCAVNCFALISGYVGYTSQFKISKTVKLWLQTLFYTVLCVIVFSIIMPHTVDIKSMISAVLPFSRRGYWYISAYFAVMLLMPLLNTVLEHTNKKVLGTILLSAFALFSVLPTLMRSDPYSLNNGYGALWLSLLYLAGGYIHKYHIAEQVKNWRIWLTLFCMVAITFLAKLAVDYLEPRVSLLEAYKDTFIEYTSPTIVVIALGLLVLCSRMTVKPAPAKVLRFLSPAVLGVYLLHVNPQVWENVMKDAFVALLNQNLAVMICWIFLAALVIFIAGILVDWIRILLFKLFKIDKLCAALETWFQKKCGFLSEKV